MIFNKLLIGIICLSFFSCEKFIEVDSPISQISSDVVFRDSLTAKAALIGLYSQVTFSAGGLSGVSYMTALSADELIAATLTQDDNQFYRNDILTTNAKNNSYWQTCYKSIYMSNSIIESIRDVTEINSKLKEQIISEAMVIRAFYYVNLVNLYGDVPYISTTDYLVNKNLARASRDQIYAKIINDLLFAKDRLVADYRYSEGERIRVTRWAAMALLARLYLYTGKWSSAEITSTEIINQTSLFSLSNDLNDVFLKNSSESIWQLMPSQYQYYTNDGSAFIQPSGLMSGILSEGLLNSFEVDDLRKSNWLALGTSQGVSWYYPFKYKQNSSDATGVEYLMVLRLAEQFLIRAEARAHLGVLIGDNSAESDINIIRSRSGLGSTDAASKDEILDAIENERRLELFTEWGHRWVDLKRFGRIDQVLGSLKPNWSSFDTLFPIPQSERLVNPKLSQNSGY